MNINEQIKTLNPSVAPALFRRLMRDDDVAYLRDGDGIIGFEVLPDSKPISGFALIGMRKHTILSFRGEKKPLKLIIFPSMDKLFNPSMELLTLSAKKVFIESDTFNGEILGEGTVAELSRELTPPEKDVELPDNLTEKMIRITLTKKKVTLNLHMLAPKDFYQSVMRKIQWLWKYQNWTIHISTHMIMTNQKNLLILLMGRISHRNMMLWILQL